MPYLPDVNESLRLLIVEDDPVLADVVRRYLEKEGFAVRHESDGQAGLEAALTWNPSLVVLDLMLPGLNGLDVCHRIRQSAPIPIVMLTARDSEDDRVRGLELGADDYLAKPFSPRELVARIRAVLRRTATMPAESPASAVRRAGEIELDLVAHEARVRGEVVPLATKEFELLAHLMANPGVAFAREDLLEAVWGHRIGDGATVTVHMRRLREKLEDDASDPQHLMTVRGLGYRFDG